MPRPKRLNLPGVPQHVTQHGNNRQACFFEDADDCLYLSLLAVACQRHPCAVHAYVLMTNHVHLLITPEFAQGLSLVMRDLGRDYVRNVNKAYRRAGTMWEGRFKSSLVDSENYCLSCYRYIESNPVRAHMVAHPREYPWSSFHVNALGRSDDAVSKKSVMQFAKDFLPAQKNSKDKSRQHFRSSSEMGNGAGRSRKQSLGIRCIRPLCYADHRRLHRPDRFSQRLYG